MANEPLAMTLKTAIAKLSAHSDLDGRGKDILAAATTLRDSRGHARLNALRLMSKPWGVDRREKIYGKWKERSLATVASELGTAVCLAAARWRPKPDGQTEQRGVPEHASSSSGSMAANPEQPSGAANEAEAKEAPGASTERCAKKARNQEYSVRVHRENDRRKKHAMGEL